MTDQENPFNEDDNQFNDELSDFYEAGDEGAAAADPKQAKKGKLGSKLSGKFSGKMPKFMDKIPEKYRTRRTAVIVAFVILVIIVYLFLSGGSNNVEHVNVAAPVHPVQTTKSAVMPMMPSIAPQPKVKKVIALPVAKPVQKKAVSQKSELAAFANVPSVKPAKVVPAHKITVASGVSKTDLSSALNSLVGKIETMDENQVGLITKKLDNQAANFNAQNRKLQSKIGDLQTQMAGLKKQLSRSQASVAALQGKVHNIIQGYTGSFNANGEASYKGVPKVASAKIAKSAKAAVNVITYTVRAVVPGRAWLSSSNGKTMTIAVGDKLPGYGNVVDINSMNGTVVTSTGVVIKTAGQ